MKIFVAVLALFLTVALLADDTGSACTRKEAQDMVEAINKARKAVGSPPVKWSAEIAKYAQAWADQIAKTGDVQHRPMDGEWAEKYGENIALGSGSKGTILAGVKMWLDEGQLYKPGTPMPANSDAFHYTQMVWAASTEIGAGRALIKAGKYKGCWLTVCNFNPPGNTSGELPYEVKKK